MEHHREEVAPLLVLNLTVLGGLAAALVLALGLLHLLERVVGRFVSHRLGWRAVLVTGWIGVPVHEVSHLAMAVVFRHRIVGWSLFDPDPATGTLGYVRHAYRRRNPWQLLGSFFIGIAPLVGGAAVLALVLVWMVPPTRLVAMLTQSGLVPPAQTAPHLLSAADLIRGLGDLGLRLAAGLWHARTPWLPLQLYLCAAVAAHLSPSPRDLLGGLLGALFFTVVLAAGAALGALLGASLGGALLVVPVMALLVTLTGLFQGLYAVTVAVIAACFGRR
jgi:hypothetical protein